MAKKDHTCENCTGTENALFKTNPKLELTTKLRSKFCCLSINKISNPELFQEFRNKLCESTQIVQANLDADLHFYKSYQQSNYKLNLHNRNARFVRFVVNRILRTRISTSESAGC